MFNDLAGHFSLINLPGNFRVFYPSLGTTPTFSGAGAWLHFRPETVNKKFHIKYHIYIFNCSNNSIVTLIYFQNMVKIWSKLLKYNKGTHPNLLYGAIGLFWRSHLEEKTFYWIKQFEWIDWIWIRLNNMLFFDTEQ